MKSMATNKSLVNQPTRNIICEPNSVCKLNIWDESPTKKISNLNVILIVQLSVKININPSTTPLYSFYAA